MLIIKLYFNQLGKSSIVSPIELLLSMYPSCLQSDLISGFLLVAFIILVQNSKFAFTSL